VFLYMNEQEVTDLAKKLVKELLDQAPLAISASKLSTFDISEATNCCEGMCPCDSKCGADQGPGSKCICQGKCACHEKTPFVDELDIVTNLYRLPQDQLKSVMDAAPIIKRIRSSVAITDESKATQKSGTADSGGDIAGMGQ
jgi:hypothetical protein